MNEHDKANLAFLLTADVNTIKTWYINSKEDDRRYAAQLISQYTEELILASEDLQQSRIESQLDDMEGNYGAAKDVLAKFVK